MMALFAAPKAPPFFGEKYACGVFELPVQRNAHKRDKKI
jgi:hypothetical protein